MTLSWRRKSLSSPLVVSAQNSIRELEDSSLVAQWSDEAIFLPHVHQTGGQLLEEKFHKLLARCWAVHRPSVQSPEFWRHRTSWPHVVFHKDNDKHINYPSVIGSLRFGLRLPGGRLWKSTKGKTLFEKEGNDMGQLRESRYDLFEKCIKNQGTQTSKK